MTQIETEIQVLNDFLKIANYNDPKYNYYKLAEELAELSEIVLKMANKKEEYRPPKEKLVEEAGDVLCRLYIVLAKDDAIEGAEIRSMEKLNSLVNKVDKNLYKGGV